MVENIDYGVIGEKEMIDDLLNETEYCVLCGDKTPYVKSDNINIRKHFVEGVGQLCPICDCKLDIHITKVRNGK